jgi:Flp pilus assembly protein TadD
VPMEATGSRLAQFHVGLGRTLAALGAPRLAAQAFRDAVRIQPQLAGAHFALGDALGRTQRWGEAASAYAAAARLRNDAEYQGNLVHALGRAFRWRDALQACNRFGELLAEDADVLLLRGLILRRLGRANEAILAFRRAAQLPAAPPGRRFFLGEALFGGEDWRKAHAALAQARGIGPGSAVGSRLNVAPIRRAPARQPRRVAPRRRRLAAIAPALRRLRAALLLGFAVCWRGSARVSGGAVLLMTRILRPRPHHALRAVRTARGLRAAGSLTSLG